MCKEEILEIFFEYSDNVSFRISEKKESESEPYKLEKYILKANYYFLQIDIICHCQKVPKPYFESKISMS